MTARKPVIDPKREPINLHGFYITPFGKKEVTIEGSGATTAIKKSVDFEVVTDIVKKSINGHKLIIGDTEYGFSLATHQVCAKFLDESIMANIDAADFVVVDWTSANHNVLNEAGYAHGRAKHGIYLCGDGSLPSDKAGIIYAFYEPERPEHLAKTTLDLLPELVRRIEAGPRVFDYYDARSPDLIDRMVHNTKKEICFLQTNLETVNANHLASLVAALRREVKLRILTLDPQSRYVNERALQLGYTNSTIKVYRNGLQNAIENVAARLQGLPGWHIRLYNDFPTQLTYVFDEHILVSTMSRTGRSRENCTFLLPTSRLPGPRQTFINHFDKLWKQADQEISSSNQAMQPTGRADG